MKIRLIEVSGPTVFWKVQRKCYFLGIFGYWKDLKPSNSTSAIFYDFSNAERFYEAYKAQFEPEKIEVIKQYNSYADFELPDRP